MTEGRLQRIEYSLKLGRVDGRDFKTTPLTDEHAPHLSNIEGDRGNRLLDTNVCIDLICPPLPRLGRESGSYL
jgi:hypothetical protein